MGILWMSFIAAEIVMLPNLFMSIFLLIHFNSEIQAMNYMMTKEKGPI